MTVEDAYREVRAVAEKAAHLGRQEDSEGAELIGHGPLAWLHAFFPPLRPQAVTELESEVGRPLPGSYRQLLGLSNGLNLFLTAFCVHGRRTGYDRAPDAPREPFDVVLLNTHERPPDMPESAVVIGGWDWDGSHVFLDADGTAGRCARDDGATVFNSWPSLGDLLVVETRRLDALFDDDGRERDEAEPTCPLPVVA